MSKFNLDLKEIINDDGDQCVYCCDWVDKSLFQEIAIAYLVGNYGDDDEITIDPPIHCFGRWEIDNDWESEEEENPRQLLYTYKKNQSDSFKITIADFYIEY